MRYYSILISGGAIGGSLAATQGAAGASAPGSGATADSSSTNALRKEFLDTIKRRKRRHQLVTSFAAVDDGWDPAASEFPNLAPSADTTIAGGNITVNKAGVPIPAVSGAAVSGAQFTSVVNGINDPGALDIEFEFELAQNKPQVSNHLKIKGIPFGLIGQQTNLNGCRVQVWAGFSPGLPLANLQVPHQGLIIDGVIFPQFGNWVYDELSLEMFITNINADNGIGGPTNPKNIIHNMPPGTTLGDAIQQALSTAFPGTQVIVAISGGLVLSGPDYGYHESLEQYANYVKSLSHSILGTPSTTGYQGVVISTQGNVIYVADGTQPTGAINIIYEDLIGQPTWINVNEIQVKTCLRGDLPFPNYCAITLPPTLVTETASAAVAGTRNFLQFQGAFLVTNVRHIGRFRSPSMDAWVTIINAVIPGTAPGQVTQ